MSNQKRNELITERKQSYTVEPESVPELIHHQVRGLIVNDRSAENYYKSLRNTMEFIREALEAYDKEKYATFRGSHKIRGTNE